MRIEQLCPTCGKHKGVKDSWPTRSSILHVLECGHSYEEARLRVAPTKAELATSTDGRDSIWSKLFPYQQEGIQFIERSNFRALLGDDMGLGKTIQAIGAIRYNYEALRPILVVVPAALTYKWQREFKIWFNDRYKEPEDAPLINFNSDGYFIEDQNIHIVSNAILGKPKMLEGALNYGFRTIVADESHSFKNDNSSRTKAMIKLAEAIPNKILLSGTSILNRTSEYFNTLHIIHPEHWPNKGYLNAYCAFDRRGKLLGIAESRRQAFFNRTSSYIIRRKKDEVLKDLPPKFVNYEYIALNDQSNFVKSYNNTLDELEQTLAEYHRSISTKMMDILSLMSRLRHIVGLAKVGTVSEYVKEFVETSGEKICIGTHHKLVLDFLKRNLTYRVCTKCRNVSFAEKLEGVILECETCCSPLGDSLEPITIADEQPHIKDERSNLFRDNSDRRIMIASILGCGIGRDLQFCTNAIIAEREWNASIERQFEDRFHRIGTPGKVNIKYILAKDTIDEFFHDMVLLKGQIASSALDADFAADQSFMLELAENVVRKRMKYVG